VQYKWRQKDADGDLDAEREPTRTNILDDLPLVDFMHSEGLLFLRFESAAT
jgi:hypothetical protein